jgi:hypothetical protein
MELKFNIKEATKNTVIEGYDDLSQGCFDLLSSPEINTKKVFSDDLEAFKSWFINGTIYPKLRGGGIESLSAACNTLIVEIVANSYNIHIMSKALRETLILENIIDMETTYEDVMNNGLLKAMIFDSIKVNLSTSPNLSKFGGGILSDFDLMVNLQGNTAFTKKMSELNINEESTVYEELKKARGTVRRFVVKIRQTIILMMDLPETPTKNELQKERKTKKAKTKADVVEELNQKKENLKRSVDKIQLSDNDDEESNQNNE